MPTEQEHMTAPPITPTHIAMALAGDLVEPEWAAWFLGVTLQRLAYWRRSKVRGGPPLLHYGRRALRYPVSGLIAWREQHCSG